MAAGSVDLNELKEQIRSALSDANTTTGSPIDLSQNLSNRVIGISKVNPERIKPNYNELPAVCVYTSSKSIAPRTIAKDQISGKRRGNIRLTVAGLVWNDITSTITEDPSDEDLENLMENIEVILRSYPDLGGNVEWQHPTDVTYHQASFDEETHFRIAFMDIECMKLY